MAVLYHVVWLYHNYPLTRLCMGIEVAPSYFAGTNIDAKNNLVQMYFQINIIFISLKQLNSCFHQVVFDGENFRVMYVLTCFSSFESIFSVSNC